MELITEKPVKQFDTSAIAKGNLIYTLQAGEWSTTRRKRKYSALKRALHSWDSSIG